MAAKIYDKIPIVDTARRCGLVLDSRTLRRKEVEASCPFCGDHGPGKYHLSLNTDTDQYRCNLCGTHGNSVSLYARIKGICNKEAYLELAHESKVYPLPQSPSPQTQERQPCSLEQRHAVYSDMLAHLTLLPKHGENLLERGLSEERIRRNEYRSMPETERGRRLLADLLRSHGHDLHGIPGFRTYYGDWTLSGPNGFLIPVRNKEGLIQGLKIRLNDAQQANRKYRWLSSRNLPSGTRSYSWVHVTGNTQSKRAFLTEGPLKGDVASFLAQDALFICIGGVNALNGLNDTVRELGVREVVEAMDMDQMTNPNVRKAILTMRKEVQKIPGIRYVQKMPTIKAAKSAQTKKQVSLRVKRQNIENKLEQLLHDLTTGLITRDEYEYIKRCYNEQYAQIQSEEIALRETMKVAEMQLRSAEQWLAEVKRYQKIPVIDRPMIDLLIREIKVFQDRSVKIELNYADPCQPLYAYMDLYTEERHAV